MEYIRRILDTELDELLPDLPALAIEGAKGVGKTETARRRADASVRLDDPAQLSLVQADPALLGARRGTILIDEWQRHPPVWDYVRRAVDDGAPPGRFLMTGSAAPTDASTHSGAGRIVQLRMRPMALAERGLCSPTVSLGELLTGSGPDIAGECSVDLITYVEEILTSGFPAIRTYEGRARRAQLSGYLARVIDREFPEQGHRVRRPDTLRGWLAAYAAATATSTSYNTILDAATPGVSDKPAKTTTSAYREILTQLWLLDPVPGWSPGNNHLGRLARAPKLHLADPALAAVLLGVDADALLAGAPVGPALPRDGTLLGALFESLVTLSTRVYAQVHEARVSHLREQSGRHEVDLIVERADHRVLALEVKLGAAPNDPDVKHLLWLREKLGGDLLDMAVINTGNYAYRRPDGIAVIPAALLTA